MQGGEVLLALAFALLAGGGAYAVGLALNALAAVRFAEQVARKGGGQA